MINRPRRLRVNEKIRNLVRETSISPSDFILPIFLVEGNNIKEEISSLPGCYHYSVDRLEEIVREVNETNIGGLLLFGIPSKKDAVGSEAYSDNGIIQKGIRRFR